MSYDTNLYFADAEFPFQLWNEALNLFEFEALQLEEGSPIDTLHLLLPRPKILAMWIVRNKGGSVLCELHDVRGAGYSEVDGAIWRIGTHCTKSALDVFCCISLAYATLTLMEGAKWIDGWFDLVARSDEEFRRQCVPRLESHFRSRGANKMFEAGVLDSDGKLHL